MFYRFTISPKALKVLEKIDDSFYSKIKDTIYSPSTNPCPVGDLKLKGREGY
jgi:mRNA interferase RelE/StbE